MARIVELIWSHDRVGKGIEEDPIRVITELWTKDGRVIATYDPFKNESYVSSKIAQLLAESS